MKKRILSLLLLFCITNTMLISNLAYAQEISIVDAYSNALMQHGTDTMSWKTSTGETKTLTIYSKYALYDIDKDNSPELLVDDANDNKIYVYTFKNSEIACWSGYVDAYGTDNGYYEHPNGNGIIIYGGGTGSDHFESVSKYILKNEEISFNEEVASGYTLDGSVNELRDSLVEYKNITFKETTDLSLIKNLLNIDNKKGFSILDGDFSEFAGIYKYNSGHSFELLANGLSDTNVSNEEIEFRVEDITKCSDGRYMWSANCYYYGECMDGIAYVLYPKGVEVVSYDGRILSTDTSKVRLWCGNDIISDAQYIAYKQDEAADEIKVVLNGEEIEFDQPPVMTNDRVMVPIRAIFEAMGYTVNWNGETQTAEAIKLNNNITVQINNNIIRYAVNGKSGIYECDVVPQIISGRTLVPVRAIAESAGCDVQWNGENTTVIITYYENSSNQLPERNVKALLLAGYDDNEDTKLQKNHLSANRLSVDYVERALNTLNVYNIEKHYMENDNNYMSASELSTLLSLTFKETTDNDLSIIYYSGHSFYYFDEYDNEKHITAFSNYTFQDFYNIIRENVKGDVLLMYDGCYAGELMNLNNYDDRIKIIAACDEDDYSSSYYLSEIDTTSDENKICSIFAYALYNGAINNINYLDLNNDKNVAFDELYVYLLNSVYNICDRITTQEDKLNRLKDMLGLDSALRIAQIVQAYPNLDTTPLFTIK